MDSCEALKGMGYCIHVQVQRECALTCGGCSSPPPSLPSPSPPCTGHTFTSKADLRTAATEYDSDADAATAKYGAIAGWCVSGVTDMSSLFHSLISFNADISGWDTSRVTDMSLMFVNASAFNQPMSWDTSRVTDMNSMFFAAPAFNQPLSWDTSGVTDMNFMFFFAYGFNQPLLDWDTSRVTDMYYMFGFAYAFNQPLDWDTSSVTDMKHMFDQASAFNQPLSWETSSVTDMSKMFLGTDSLSAANKLLIRCAWAGTPAFARAGYDSSWAPGSCP